MQKQSIVSIILGVGTTLFVGMIILPPPSLQKPSGLSSIPVDVIEDEETDDNLT